MSSSEVRALIEVTINTETQEVYVRADQSSYQKPIIDFEAQEQLTQVVEKVKSEEYSLKRNAIVAGCAFTAFAATVYPPVFGDILFTGVNTPTDIATMASIGLIDAGCAWYGVRTLLGRTKPMRSRQTDIESLGPMLGEKDCS